MSGCRVRTKQRARRRKLQPFSPRIILENKLANAWRANKNTAGIYRAYRVQLLFIFTMQKPADRAARVKEMGGSVAVIMNHVITVLLSNQQAVNSHYYYLLGLGETIISLMV